jgi:hypothetical protein
MRGYVTDSRVKYTAECQARALQAGLNIGELGRQIAKNPDRFGASEHLGHTCLVWARVMYPYDHDSSLSSLLDVLGVAIGPYDTITQETHRTWNAEYKSSRPASYTDAQGDCKQLVRGGDAQVTEYRLDGTWNVVHDRKMPPLGRALRLQYDLGQLVEGADPRIFVGEAAETWARQMMAPPVGHRFGHPALQEFWAQRIAAAPMAA